MITLSGELLRCSYGVLSGLDKRDIVDLYALKGIVIRLVSCETKDATEWTTHKFDSYVKQILRIYREEVIWNHGIVQTIINLKNETGAWCNG